MAKYLFVNVPAYGHVNPTLPLVQELVRRGEEVVYYLTEEFRQAVEATGARLLPYQPFGGKPQPPTAAQKQPAEGAKGEGKGGWEGPFEMLERVRQEQPDYLVYDAMHLWARTVAEALRIPAILSCPTFVANEHFNPLKDHFDLLGGRIAAPMAIPPGVLAKIQGVITLVRQKYNLGAFDMSDFYAHTEKLNIVYMPRAFHPSGELFDERYAFIGPPLFSATTQEHLRSEPADRETLYISLGTIYNDRPEFFQQCFEAFEGQEWDVIVSRGRAGEVDGTVPANFKVEAYVEQWKIFPHTDVFVTHGGMSSVMESLSYGVPMVVIPQQAEQIMTSRRIVELGLGVALDPETVTAQELREAVEKVRQDEAIHQRVQEMQQTVWAAGGASSGADAIQHFASRLLAVKTA